MLQRIIDERWFEPKAVIGFWPANAVGDDIRLYTDEDRATQLATVPHAAPAAPEARRPAERGAVGFRRAGRARPTRSAASSSRPAPRRSRSPSASRRRNDDYSSILVKALADRFAEAFAERLHERVRREFWGYAPDEAFTPEELIGEPYRGIRPAPGYPAQPDHTEKATLFRLLDADAARPASR